MTSITAKASQLKYITIRRAASRHLVEVCWGVALALQCGFRYDVASGFGRLDMCTH